MESGPHEKENRDGLHPILDHRRNEQRLMSQGGAQLSRTESPNKQSVLVKRVLRDGRVVSGLDKIGSSMRKKQNSEPAEDDLGTLGSQNAASFGNPNTRGRESKAVHHTVDGNESQMHSTMYITGKSQRFKLNTLRLPGVKGTSPQGQNSPLAKAVVINLGERTANNFTSKETDMLVGGTDLETGTSKMQQPQVSGKNFNPKIRPKKEAHSRAGSYASNGGSLHDLAKGHVVGI